MKVYLDPEDISSLEAAANNMRDKLLIRVLWRLGCRVSEAIGLTTDDIDLDQGMVTILHLKSRIKLACPQCEGSLAKYHSFCPKCGCQVTGVVARAQEQRKQRTLPLDKETLALLKDYINGGGDKDRNGRHYIFGINRHRAWQIIKEYTHKAGLPDLVNPDTGRSRGISPHRLRDAFASHAMRINDTRDGLRLLQEHLGHASFNTTAKYRKIAGEEHRRWYDRLWQEGT